MYIILGDLRKALCLQYPVCVMQVLQTTENNMGDLWILCNAKTYTQTNRQIDHQPYVADNVCYIVR